ncbi:hypothetical protein HDU87_003788 [Geranomyces variabilis]|uniref:DUF4396 domain-containing protein n=1 Tax=Geranomyces variabilis TaxID=109894 RepID=A0AAD5TJ38_9FUNG|nr:hypothetical protein HDU87_003788 [Geranomyces variabilis]
MLSLKLSSAAVASPARTAWRSQLLPRSTLVAIAHWRVPSRQATSSPPSTCCHSKSSITAPPSPRAPITRDFFRDRNVWHRASSNTLRCLVGCTAGDFSAMFYIQSHYPALPPSVTMAISMAAGITTSVVLETAVMRLYEGMALGKSFNTALGMSMISMLVMEAAENVVDWHLTGGVVAFADPWFWAAGATAMGAGYVAALPWNYYRLKRFGKSCH